MAKYLTHTDLLKTHGKMRALVNDISREAAKVRKQAAKAKADGQRLYANIVSKPQKKQLIADYVHSIVDPVAKPVRTAMVPKLREMEGLRLQLEDARENLTNPITRLNAITALDKQYVAQRALANQVLSTSGPGEMAVIAEAARASGDLATLAACLSHNSNLSAKQRPFSNAELLKDFPLPDQDAIKAIYEEAYSLPTYAMHCERAFDLLGEIKPVDKIEAALKARMVKTSEDGTLEAFVTEERYRFDVQEEIDRQKPAPKIDPKDLKPEDFDSLGEYLASGGSTDVAWDLGDAGHEALREAKNAAANDVADDDGDEE